MTLSALVERQRSLVDFTLASLGRRKGKNLSLLLVYALVVFLLSSTLLLTQALRAEAAAVLRDGPDVVVQRLQAGRHELIAAAEVERLAAIRGVRGATGRRWGYYFDPGVHANYTVMVPERFWGTDREAVVGEGVARVRRLTPGDELWLRSYQGELLRFAVREVLPASTSLVSADLVLLSDRAYVAVFGADPARFTDIALSVPNAKEVPKVAEKVLRLLPDARVVTRQEILRTYEAVFDWRSGLVTVVLMTAVLGFALVAWDKAAGLSADERREIGILKAIGWDVSDVLWVKTWEGAVLSLAAFSIGFVAAYVHVFLGQGGVFAPVLRGWSTLSPTLALTPSASGLQVATLLFLTVVPYTVATVVPAWRAASADPDEVMRS